MKHKSTDELIGELMSKPSFEEYLHANGPFFSEKGVAELLAQLYETKNLTKAELARRSGISEVYLHQVFAGRRNPSRDRLLCICIGLGITLDETQRMLTQGGLRPTVSPHQTGRHYQLRRGPSAAPGGDQ